MPGDKLQVWKYGICKEQQRCQMHNENSISKHNFPSTVLYVVDKK
jgi:hypothetical protein